jgi:uncharacterized SAM-binding protein YcdF (DUF218 family)
MSFIKWHKFLGYYHLFRRLVKYLLISTGIAFLLAIALSFTDCPFRAYYWLGTNNSELNDDPEFIVVMGGGGMPSPEGLIRCYYAADVALSYVNAAVIIAVPSDTSLKEESPELLMARELIIRGIDSSKIKYETDGYSTHTQALNIYKLFDKVAADTSVIRIVTSPEHMFRSVASFRKAGFKEVGGMPSFEEAIKEQLLLKKDNNRSRSKINRQGLALRYNTWNYMKYEIIVLREWIAILYYKIRGWI